MYLLPGVFGVGHACISRPAHRGGCVKGGASCGAAAATLPCTWYVDLFTMGHPGLFVSDMAAVVVWVVVVTGCI